MVISNVSDKVAVGLQSDISTIATTTDLLMGKIESLTYQEIESLDKFASVGDDSTYGDIEEQLYYVEGVLTTKLTKNSVENVLEACLGEKTSATGTYTFEVKNNSTKYYTFKARHNSTQYAEITGAVVNSFTLEVSTEGYAVATLNYNARKLELKTGSVSQTQDTSKVFTYLDCNGKYNTTDFVISTFSISGDWNVDMTEGRGIQIEGTDRRLVGDIIRHRCNVTASVDYRVDSSFLTFGYEDEKGFVDIDLILNRGTSNQHTFTLLNCKTDNREQSVTNEDSIKEGSFDVEAKSMQVVGDEA